MMDEFNRPVYPAVLGTEEEITTAPVEMGEPVVREQWASIVDEYEEGQCLCLDCSFMLKR